MKTKRKPLVHHRPNLGLAENMFWAAIEVIEDYDNFGEVLQMDEDCEYGKESAIEKLKTETYKYRDNL